MWNVVFLNNPPFKWWMFRKRVFPSENKRYKTIEFAALR